MVSPTALRHEILLLIGGGEVRAGSTDDDLLSLHLDRQLAHAGHPAVGPRRREAAVGHSHRLQQNGRGRSQRSKEALGFRVGAEGQARLQDAWPPFATIGSVCGSRSLAIVDRG
jgi:hypothetical protein